jgi:hypothetical protein
MQFTPGIQGIQAGMGDHATNYGGWTGSSQRGPAAKPFDWGSVLRPQQQAAPQQRGFSGGFRQSSGPMQVGPAQRSKFDTAGIASMVGGKSGPSPEITVGPIWNDQQTDQRVNQMRAASDQTTAGNINRMSQSTAGRGFGTNSPLQQALQAQMQGANLAQKTGAENDLRWGAAEGNKKHILGTQKARSDQFSDRMAEDIERRRNMAGVWMAALNGPEGMDYGFGTSEMPQTKAAAASKTASASDPRPADVKNRVMTPAEVQAMQAWQGREQARRSAAMYG